MRQKKAEMGMGTLIIFIAMILVAAIAASVLISTTGSLQNKALSTGKATTQEDGTSISTIEIYAEDGTNQNVTYWYKTIKLGAGADPLRLTDTLLYMNLDDTTRDYRYVDTINCSATSDMDSNNAKFGAEYQIRGTSNKNGYVNTGDVVKLCFKSPRNVTEGERFKITLIPMIGSALSVETTTPSLMINTRVPIYP
jgi:flagellin FlaB